MIIREVRLENLNDRRVRSGFCILPGHNPNAFLPYSYYTQLLGSSYAEPIQIQRWRLGPIGFSNRPITQRIHSIQLGYTGPEIDLPESWWLIHGFSQDSHCVLTYDIATLENLMQRWTFIGQWRDSLYEEAVTVPTMDVPAMDLSGSITLPIASPKPKAPALGNLLAG